MNRIKGQRVWNGGGKSGNGLGPDKSKDEERETRGKCMGGRGRKVLKVHRGKVGI